MSIKKLIITIIVINVEIIFTLFFTTRNSNAQNWPMLNGNKERTSWAEFETRLNPPLEKTVQFSLDNGSSSGISFYEKTLFVSVAGDPNRVVAFDAKTGNELWHFQIPETRAAVNVVPAVNDSLVLCGGQKGLGLYALDRLTGGEKWFKSVGSLYAKNPILDSNRVYIVADSLYCLGISDGGTIWSFPFSKPVSPAVDDENVYLCGDRKLIAFNKLNGEIIWQIKNSQRYYTSLAVDENYVYTCNNDSIVALNKGTGSVHWSYNIPDGTTPDLSTNAIAISDNFLCFSIWENSEHKGQLYTLDKITGNYSWHYTFDTTGVFSPAIANGVVYTINWKTNSVWGFDLKTGQPVFYDNSERYHNQPIVANNTLYVGAFGKVVSFENPSTGINSISFESKKSFELSPNWPNPFNQSTRFQFHLVQSGYLDISIYNLSGERVKTISTKKYAAGTHVLTWDATNNSNQTVPSGIYILKLYNKHYIKSTKMILLK